MAEWCSSPYFCMKVREKYLAIRPYLTALLADGGTYDQHVAYIRESGIANENRWFYRTGFSGPTGDAAVFKQFLKDRLALARRQVHHPRYDGREHRHPSPQLSAPPRDLDPHAVVPEPFGQSGA